MLENRNVVYFSRFCQLIFNLCCPDIEILENDVIPSFKLHKRIFSDLTNKDIKKGDVGVLMLPEYVQQFLINSQQQPSPAHAEAGASNANDMPQKKRMKKRRANRAKSSILDEETETDEELFIRETTIAVPEDRVFMQTVFQDEAPTSNADVVEEAAREAADEAPEILVQEATENVEPQGFYMDIEANLSINSEHFPEGLEADQDTVELAESMASHTEIISFDLEKGEEVDQSLDANATKTVATNSDVADKDATENVPVEAEFVVNSEDVIVLEALQQSVVEIVTKEAEFLHTANSEIPELDAEHISAENTAENDNDNDGSDHSQEELFESQANSDELREVNRATAEHFQDMYYNRWAAADCIFSAQRAADFLGDSVKTISTPDILTSLKATVIQIKSLHNRFDESHKEVTALRNEVGLRDLTLKNDRTYYNSMFKKQAKDSDDIQKRLGKVEENQTAMSTQLSSISTAIELLTSVLLSDDVKKGENVPKDKCKDIQALRQKEIKERLLFKGKAVVSTNPSTDEEIATKIFMKEHGKNVTIEDIQAEEQMLAEEHKKDLEAGIYKKKEIKAPRKKEVGISIKENTQQSIQYTRRPVIGNSDKGKGIMIEEPYLEKKDNSTSDIAQVETRLAKSTSDTAQVDVSTEVMTTSDAAQVVHKSTLLPGFSKPKVLEDLKLEAVNFSETRTVLGKEAFDKSGLGSHRERRTNNRSQDKFSLAEFGVGITQEGLDKLESVQMIFHKGIKKEFLLYFMADGRVYRFGEFDIQLKLWEELEYVLYLLEVKNRSTYDAARVLKERMMKSKVLSGAGVSSAYIPKYRDAHGKLVEMKRNSARFRTTLNKKVLEFNLESDKPFYIRLGNEMNKNSIYSLRAAIYQIGEDEPEMKELKKIMIAELERAEKKLLSDYIRTVPDIQEIK
ncbi:hypothetical protein POM88_032388 [Heracleum sosnowskyi]|uniref:Uncharacterized protein n=1 Tax=Heracleum sosnowskyi TaxID=360622 RepID=A0AAD8I244_9APIA|nr:hypothetical protein POM88_032388 [Heracleum sosnowskyi]